MENWGKAIRLEQFIRNYIPKGFKEAIHIYSFVPCVSEENYSVLKDAYEKGNLTEVIKGYSEPIYEKYFGVKVFRFDRRDIIEAMQEYFKHREGK